MDYLGLAYLNVSLRQVLQKEGVEQEFILEVKSVASKRIIDASKEICPLHSNIRCPGRLANHSQLKSNGANIKPTVIELLQIGDKIVVFRATRDILPFEQLRFDYRFPADIWLMESSEHSFRFQNNHLFVNGPSIFHFLYFNFTSNFVLTHYIVLLQIQMFFL